MPVLPLPPDPELTLWPRDGMVAVLDIEYTAWEGSQQRKWSEPWEYREIIHAGAVLLDAAAFSERGSFEAYAKPRRNPQLSPYIQNLTGITDAAIGEHGQPFTEAYRGMSGFLAPAGAVFVNGLDGLIVRENCALNELPPEFCGGRIFNIRPALARVLGRDQKDVVSSDLPGILGCDSILPKHSGLADARAIALALRTLRSQARI